jgi:hypothetical protein
MAKGMGRWAVGLAMVLGVLDVERPATAGPLEPLTLSLLVVNQSAVRGSVLVHAEAEATRIYSALGVHLIWINAGAPNTDFNFTVTIVPTPLSAKESDSDALGVAPGTKTTRGRIAYAFWGRIEDFSASHGVDVAVILGHVIAHELGHLLLPYNAHTKTGIMSGGWDDQQATRAERGALFFNAAESAQIRETLSRAMSQRLHQDGNDRGSDARERCPERVG